MSQLSDVKNISAPFKNNNLLSFLFDKDSFLSKHTMSFLPGKPGREWTFNEAVSSGHLYLVKFLFTDFHRKNDGYVDTHAFLQALEGHTNTEDKITKTRYFSVIEFVLQNCYLPRDLFFGVSHRIVDYDSDILNLLTRGNKQGYFSGFNNCIESALRLKKFDVIKLLLKNKVEIDEYLLFRIYQTADIKTIKHLYLTGVRPENGDLSKYGKFVTKDYDNLIFSSEDGRGTDEPDVDEYTLLCFYKVGGTIKRDVWTRIDCGDYNEPYELEDIWYSERHGVYIQDYDYEYVYEDNDAFHEYMYEDNDNEDVAFNINIT